MSTQQPAKISARYSIWDGSVQDFEVRFGYSTREEADALLASLPKSLKLRAHHGSTRSEVAGYTNLCASEVAGTRNETGIARYWKLVALLAKRGIDVEWVAWEGNAYETQDAFERAISEA